MFYSIFTFSARMKRSTNFHQTEKKHFDILGGAENVMYDGYN